MNPNQSDHPGELTDNELNQLLAAANEELLAHINACTAPRQVGVVHGTPLCPVHRTCTGRVPCRGGDK